MDNAAALRAFFDAENAREWDTYRGFLHPDVVWELHAAQARSIRGIDAYMDAIRAAYRGSGVRFRCLEMHARRDGGRIVALLENDLGECSCDIFEFRDGQIYREYEFIL